MMPRSLRNALLCSLGIPLGVLIALTCGCATAPSASYRKVQYREALASLPHGQRAFIRPGQTASVFVLGDGSRGIAVEEAAW